MTCSSDPGPWSGSSASNSWSAGSSLPLRGAHPPRFPPGGGDQPAGERRRGMDVVQVRDQAHPDRLQHVLGITRSSARRARDVPEQRAEFGHDLAERVLAALSGRAHQAAMRAPRSGWLARTVTCSRSSTETGLHPQFLLMPSLLFFHRAQLRQGCHRPLAAAPGPALSSFRPASCAAPVQQRPGDERGPVGSRERRAAPDRETAGVVVGIECLASGRQRPLVASC